MYHSSPVGLARVPHPSYRTPPRPLPAGLHRHPASRCCPLWRRAGCLHDRHQAALLIGLPTGSRDCSAACPRWFQHVQGGPHAEVTHVPETHHCVTCRAYNPVRAPCCCTPAAVQHVSVQLRPPARGTSHQGADGHKSLLGHVHVPRGRARERASAHTWCATANWA